MAGVAPGEAPAPPAAQAANDGAGAPVYTQDWFSLNESVWPPLFAPYAGRPGLRALEVGVFEGRATRWLLERVLTGAGATIDCVDTFEGSDEYAPMGVEVSGLRARFEANVGAWPGRVRIHAGRSAEVLRRLDGPWDVAYIDGSHAAPDVLADAILAWPRIVPGGLVIFDDYAWDWFARPEKNPRLGIDAFLSCHVGQYEILHFGYQVALRKLAAYDAAVAANLLATRPTGHPG